MARTLKVIALAVLFSFLWGVWWATKDKNPLLQPEAAESISVLAPADIFSQNLLDIFRSKGLIVELTVQQDSYNLLREILSPVRNYDVIVFPSTLTDSLQFSNYFSEHFGEKKFDELGVSIDFRSLNFDSENRFLTPLLWVVYGWAIKKADPDFSLLVYAKDDKDKKLAAIPSPELLYGLLQKLSPEAHSYFQTSNEEELTSVLNSFKKKVELKPAYPEEWKNFSAVQVPHTSLQELELQGYTFALPLEKADLVLLLAAFNKKSSKQALGDQFLKILFENKSVKELVAQSQMASVKSHERTETLFADVFQSNYIRSLPISRLGLLSYHEAFEPLFTQFLKENYSAALREKSAP